MWPRLWRRWAEYRLKPFAVLRKRLAAARLVFNLGIDLSFYSYPVAEAPRASLRASGTIPLLLFGCKYHDHLLALHHRVLLDDARTGEVDDYPIEELAANVLMHHLTAAETQCHLGLVPLGEKADQITQFDLIVRLPRAGTKLHFLNLNVLLLTLR